MCLPWIINKNIQTINMHIRASTDQEAKEKAQKLIDQQIAREKAGPGHQNELGAFLTLMSNTILSLLWLLFIIFLYSETTKYGLEKVMWQPRAHLQYSIGALKKVQFVQCLNLMLPLLGLTTTSIFSEVLQLFLRSLFIYISVQHTDESKGPFIFVAFVSFAIGDSIRYPYYVLKTLGAEESTAGRFFGHLRYNLFIVCYPLGASADTITGYHAAQTIREKGLYSLALPNSYNFGFDYPTLCQYVIPTGVLLGFHINYLHVFK